MKRIIAALALAGVIVITACGDDGEAASRRQLAFQCPPYDDCVGSVTSTCPLVIAGFGDSSDESCTILTLQTPTESTKEIQ